MSAEKNNTGPPKEKEIQRTAQAEAKFANDPYGSRKETPQEWLDELEVISKSVKDGIACRYLEEEEFDRLISMARTTTVEKEEVYWHGYHAGKLKEQEEISQDPYEVEFKEYRAKVDRYETALRAIGDNLDFGEDVTTQFSDLLRAKALDALENDKKKFPDFIPLRHSQ